MKKQSQLKVIVAAFTASVAFVSSAAFADLKEVSGCGSSSSDIREVASFVDSNWADFEDFIEDETGLNIKNCMENRFKDNGKIQCEASQSGNCSGANGWASYLSHTAHFCPSFLTNARAQTTEANRKACYLALMAHEFGHTCWRGHGTVEDIDDAAFKYAKNRLGASINLINCNTD